MSATPTQSSNATSEDYDISSPYWFYMDANNAKQGPFSFKEMYLWWKGSYFPDDLQVKNIWETEFKELKNVDDFQKCHPKIIEKIEQSQVQGVDNGANTDATDYDTSQYQDYAVSGGFNPSTGQFQKDDTNSYFAAKGLSSDRDVRMMSNYFDYDKYAEQMTSVSKDKNKKKKTVKGTKKFWKDRKEKKRRAKLVAEYLAD